MRGVVYARGLPEGVSPRGLGAGVGLFGGMLEAEEVEFVGVLEFEP